LQRAKESSLALDWPLYVGQAAKANFGDFDLSGRNVVGIRCPMPVGIVTFKTIIDSLLQKTGPDERGFFDRQIGRSSNSPSDYAKDSDDASITLHNTSNSHHQSKGTTIRRRKVSNKEIFAVDGAGDFSDASTEVQCTRFRRRSSQISGSSYTKNSQGGFHVAEMSNLARPKLNNAMALTSEELADFRLFTDYFSLSDPSCNLPNGIRGLLSSTSGAPILPSGLSQMCRHNSVTPALPRLQRVTPFSNQSYSNYENLAKETVKEHQIKVAAPTFPCQFHPQHDITGPISNIIAETDLSGIPQAATDHADEGKDEVILKNLHRLDGEANVDVRQAQEGFPLQFPESNHSGQENRLFPYASRTLPRMVGLTVDTTVRTDGSGYQTPVREESFQDDRALLPSQRRIMNSSATMSLGIGRSSSLWF
jgi:metal transporter CNNM